MKKIKLSIFASVIILFLLFKQDLFCQDSVLNTSDRSWVHFAFLSGGAGMHFNKERDVEKDKLLLFWEILSIKGGFKSLAGFGIGTKVYEEYYMDSIKVNSFIPEILLSAEHGYNGLCFLWFYHIILVSIPAADHHDE